MRTETSTVNLVSDWGRAIAIVVDAKIAVSIAVVYSMMILLIGC